MKFEELRDCLKSLYPEADIKDFEISTHNILSFNLLIGDDVYHCAYKWQSYTPEQIINSAIAETRKWRMSGRETE
jgi:hypothetical protein